MPDQINNTAKFCSGCGRQLPLYVVRCPACGKPVEQAGYTQVVQQPAPVIVNNYIQNGRAKSKWVALLLLIFFGVLGVHKFYEGKVGMGILYIFTLGIFGIGLIVDFFVLLFKSNPYYV